MPITIEDYWHQVVENILADPGLTIIMGATDAGKTVFALHLINSSVDANVSSALIDGDIGQSEIGISGTLSCGLADQHIDYIKDIKPLASYFIGAITPVNHLILNVVGIKILVDKLMQSSRDLIVVDTCGFVKGPNARRMNVSLLELLNPKHIVAIQKNDELEHFLRFIDLRSETNIHRMPISNNAFRKPQELRRQRRSVRFVEYFAESRNHQIAFDDAVFVGTWLGCGKTLPLKYQKYAHNVLNTNVFHGEESESGVYLVTSGEGDKKGIDELKEYFKAKLIMVVPASRYLNLLIGLMDEKHNLIGCGIIQRIDFTAKIISFISPIRTPISIKAIRFGTLKLRPDGVEMGSIHPREI